jgi:hypothetical protein
MFEVTSNDIASLTDEDLRSLIGRLCESEMRRRGISASCVTWGGHQDAGDGGIDVRVELPANLEAEGFIPRSATGFQAKAETMPRSKILPEMKPNGVLRPSISELAARSGAYIIASSKDSASETGLQDRLKAMAEAVDGIPNAQGLKLDFYDRRRLETWLRDHAGTVLWVRERVGKPLQAWSSYRAWSLAPAGTGGEFLLDDEPRIRRNQQAARPALSVVQGIHAIRNVLRSPGGIVRLVGLSGVGKTRLVEALFDTKVGERSLDPELAAYTNLSHNPNPSPVALALELIATRKRAMMIVDNCPPELHRSLSEQCRVSDSPLSVITIEYDITEDQPEGTDVFILEATSVQLTVNVIRNRFPALSSLDTQRIAEFSGGNCRIAIALAERIDNDESIAQLSDQALFTRLFQQRHQPDEALYSAAQALALVYSFDGESVSNETESELALLGSLVGKSAQEMFKHSAELERRGLMQRRARWRAVLPHAIANRLAATALQNIPPDLIGGCFNRNGRERLLKSFSRRLGYLNDVGPARSIVSGWLSRGGMLDNLEDLDDLRYSIFNNIALVDPESTVYALERAVPPIKEAR